MKYAIDYQRGVDVIHWDGPLTTPAADIPEAPLIPLLVLPGLAACAWYLRRRRALPLRG